MRSDLVLHRHRNNYNTHLHYLIKKKLKIQKNGSYFKLKRHHIKPHHWLRSCLEIACVRANTFCVHTVVAIQTAGRCGALLGAVAQLPLRTATRQRCRRVGYVRDGCGPVHIIYNIVETVVLINLGQESLTLYKNSLT